MARLLAATGPLGTGMRAWARPRPPLLGEGRRRLPLRQRRCSTPAAQLHPPPQHSPYCHRAGGRPLLTSPCWRLQRPGRQRPVRPAGPLRVRAAAGSEPGDDGLLAGKLLILLTSVGASVMPLHAVACLSMALDLKSNVLNDSCAIRRAHRRAAQQAAATGRGVPPGIARC